MTIFFLVRVDRYEKKNIQHESSLNELGFWLVVVHNPRGPITWMIFLWHVIYELLHAMWWAGLPTTFAIHMMKYAIYLLPCAYLPIIIKYFYNGT